MISLRASLWGELCAEGGCALGQGVVKDPDSETGAGYCAAWHRFHARALLYESKDLSADVCVWRGSGLLWDGGAEELDGLGTTLRILVGEFRRLVKLQVEAALRMNHHPHHQQQQTSVSMRENSCPGFGRAHMFHLPRSVEVFPTPSAAFSPPAQLGARYGWKTPWPRS